MAIDLFCYVVQNEENSQEIISRLQANYADLLTKYFVFSRPRQASSIGKEIASEYGFNAVSRFLLSLNLKKEVIRTKEAEGILKAAFGEDNILILWQNETRH
jgi:hypothetical protein